MGTFEALLVLAVAVLPGAMYTWAFEREIGSWGAGASDRIHRFVGVSALLLALAAFPAYSLYTNFLHRRTIVDGRVGYVNVIAEGGTLPPWLFLLPIAYLVVPSALGFLAARAVRRQKADGRNRWWLRLLVGRDPAPLAWDHVFSGRPAALVRVQFSDGAMLAGLFGKDSYASGYPHQPGDVYLERTYRLKEDGSFDADEDDELIEEEGSALIRWDQVRLLELFAIGRSDGKDA